MVNVSLKYKDYSVAGIIAAAAPVSALVGGLALGLKASAVGSTWGFGGLELQCQPQDWGSGGGFGLGLERKRGTARGGGRG